MIIRLKLLSCRRGETPLVFRRLWTRFLSILVTSLPTVFSTVVTRRRTVVYLVLRLSVPLNVLVRFPTCCMWASSSPRDPAARVTCYSDQSKAHRGTAHESTA